MKICINWHRDYRTQNFCCKIKQPNHKEINKIPISKDIILFNTKFCKYISAKTTSTILKTIDRLDSLQSLYKLVKLGIQIIITNAFDSVFYRFRLSRLAEQHEAHGRVETCLGREEFLIESEGVSVHPYCWLVFRLQKIINSYEFPFFFIV